MTAESGNSLARRGPPGVAAQHRGIEEGARMRAVRFEEYGDVDVLKVEEVPTPEPGPGQVVVRVVTAGTNPGEASIRSGAGKDRFTAHFPEDEGSDLAG